MLSDCLSAAVALLLCLQGLAGNVTSQCLDDNECSPNGPDDCCSGAVHHNLSCKGNTCCGCSQDGACIGVKSASDCCSGTSHFSLVCGGQRCGVMNKASYKAAVVEFAPEKWYDLPEDSRSDPVQAKALKLRNFKALASFAQDAKRQGADVMVFSEYAFTGDNQGNPPFNRISAQPYLEEIPEVGSVPCDAQDNLTSSVAITQSSCLARQLQLYLVIDINSRTPCAGQSGCPRDGMKIHNTMLAFNRGGKMLSLYHKVHPWGKEKFVDPGDEHQPLQSFTTDFGAKFGMFVCFDILFEIAVSKDVTDFAFTTDWENDAVIKPLPEPFTARNTQRSWSRLHGKNLLAANYGGNGRKSSGSGLWHKGQAKASYYNPTKNPQSKLLVADMPIIKSSVIAV